MFKSEKVIILGILISLTLGVGITYSIFFSAANLTVNQNLANFVFNAEETNAFSVPLADFAPGDKREYLFSVSNNKEGKVSEVTIEYEIIIKTYHFIPFNIRLYKIGEEEPIFECTENGFSRNEQNVLICNVTGQYMTFKEEFLVNYKLEVEFPNDFNEYSYAGLMDFIDIEIESWQKV